MPALEEVHRRPAFRRETLRGGGLSRHELHERLAKGPAFLLADGPRVDGVQCRYAPLGHVEARVLEADGSRLAGGLMVS